MNSTYKLILATKELQHRFDTKLLESAKEQLTYARNLLEFCLYQAFHQLSTSPKGIQAPQARVRGGIFNFKKSNSIIATTAIFNGIRVPRTQVTCQTRV